MPFEVIDLGLLECTGPGFGVDAFDGLPFAVGEYVRGVLVGSAVENIEGCCVEWYRYIGFSFGFVAIDPGGFA